MKIPFIDLQAQRAQIKNEIDTAIANVLQHGQFVMGPEVAQLEREIAAYVGAEHCLSCASGTDALALPLMAWGIGAGDAVFCPSFTFAATAEIIPWVGASPVFVDIEPELYLIDPIALRKAIVEVLDKGELRPRAIIAVDLFGATAEYPAISEIAQEFGLKLIADSAQGFGSTLDGYHPLHWADIATTSFFPAKPLGGYGDGGAIMTQDHELARLIDSLRIHGRAIGKENTGNWDPKYLNMRIGMNSRLDTLQAAILIQKLTIFPKEIKQRNDVASTYNQGLTPHVEACPIPGNRRTSVWAQYTIRHTKRDLLAKYLAKCGIPSAVYYPVPMHKQPPYAHYPVGSGKLPVTDSVCKTVLSLPMHPWLEKKMQKQVIDAIANFNQKR